MPKFILIDNSITGIGGHYYEYAIHVLEAARKAGYTPVLAANRRFTDSVPAYIQVQPVYQFGLWLHQTIPFVARLTMPRGSKSAADPTAPPHGLRRIAGKVKRSLRGGAKRAVHRMLSGQFRRDTARLFQRVPLADGDVVFIPSPLLTEMRGLLGYFPRDARSHAAEWHLLFRRCFYHGREEDYAAQVEAVAEFRSAFQCFRRRLRGQHVCFWTDTEELTDQYNRVGEFTFHTLPIPHTYPPAAQLSDPPSPLRAVYLGDARDVKGYHHLPRLIDELHEEYIAAGRLTFAIQSNFNILGGEERAAVARARLQTMRAKGITLYQQPLTTEQYSNLLHSADLLLLPYDPTEYYGCSSGILVEALALGIPVLVPAGGWLSQQIADQVSRYHRELSTSLRALAVHVGGDITWQRPAPSEAGTQLTIPSGASHMLLSVPESALEAGTFIRITLAAEDAIPHTLLVGRSLSGTLSTALFALPTGSTRVTLTLRNAFSTHPLDPKYFRVELFANPAAQPPPLSAVGMIYADPEDISTAMRELIEQYPHYRRTAWEFARQFYQRHNAGKLVEELVASGAVNSEQ